MKIPLKEYYDILVKYLRQQRGRFALLAALMLTSIGLQVVNPQIMRYFIDAAKSGATGNALLIAAVLFISLAIIQQLLSVWATYTGEYVAWVATNELRSDLAEHCLDLDMEFHNEKSPGEFIERIEGDSLEFSNFFSQLVLLVVGNALLMLGILVAFYLINWRLGVIFTFFSIVTMLALNRVRNVAVPYQKAFRDANTDLFGFLEERLAGTEDIRSSGAVNFVINRLLQLQRKIFLCWTDVSLKMIWVRITAGLLLAGGFAAAFISGYYLYRANVITLGVVYIVIYYTSLLGRPIREITQQVENLQNIGATVERMAEILGQKGTITDGPGAKIPSPAPLPLEFAHVNHSYVTEKQVLHDISFKLESGKILGLLGRTGSGKTTLARLVFRLYDINSGNILLAGTDIRELKLEMLRHRVAFVTQDVQLFQASVRDNITFFDNSIPDKRIMEVIEALELGEWFRALPKGLDTRLETGGRSLSAGEAQLLAFTRVFLRDPGLVILDEASSRLDPATEQLVERAIDKLLENRSAIIIAHRLGTLHRVHDIMILEEGSIVECGDRKALLADENSRFYSLHQTGLESLLV